jgi:hypothetical protein
MLESLDTIDWSQLTSCYGSAEDIPAAIRGLTSDDAAIRQEAQGTIHLSLEHQGTVYEASAYAVPFLLEVLAAPQTKDKRELVEMLAYLGCKGAHLGNDFQGLEMRLVLEKIAENKSEEPQILQDARRDARIWSEETHQAVREGLLLFLTLLADLDQAMRMETTYVLACFKEDRSWLLPPLITQLRAETDEHVICCLLLCLGQLLPPTQDASALLMKYLIEGETDLIRFTAAMALCTLLKDETPESAVHMLLHVLVDPFPLQPSYEHLPPIWGSTWVHMRAIFYLDQLTSSPHQALIIERLAEVYPALDDRVDIECADLLVRVAFYEQGFQFQTGMTFDDLDPIQQAVLRALASRDTPGTRDLLHADFHQKFLQAAQLSPHWDWYQKMCQAAPLIFQDQTAPAPLSLQVLKYVGLPTTHQGLQAFLATATRQ